MGEKNPRRRKVVVDRKFQVGVSLQIVGYVYAYLVLFALLANYGALKEVVFGDGGTPKYVEAVGRLEIFVEVFVLPLLFTFVCMCLHGVLFSHRLAGPLFRFKDALRRVRGGDLAVEVQLRDRDYFKDLCEEINALLGHLRGDLHRLRSVSSDLAEEGEALARAGNLPPEAQAKLLSIANSSSRLRQLVESYRIDLPEEPEDAEVAETAPA
jgi:methyl-accepting chemotaxis protein